MEQSDHNNAIEIRNMTKTFRIYKDKPKTLKERFIRHNKGGAISENVVLDDVSLDIKRGETVALIGTNGSGKSTLLKIMTQILYPNKGTVETFGKVTSLLELGAGFHPDFTGRENIYFNAAVFGLTREEIDRRVEDIIEFSELGDFIDEPVRTYSSGMYMRLAFSVAINVDADILLIDEILAVGDQHFQNKCYDKLIELRDSDTTIVIVSHALDMIKVLCTRAVWLYKGRVRLDGDPIYVISKYIEQSALDTGDEIEEDDDEDKEQSPRGAVFIDTPQSFDVLPLSEPLKMVGWGVSNRPDDEEDFEVLLNGQQVECERVPRPDVHAAYKREFPQKELHMETLGFEATIPPQELKEGPNKIEVFVRDGKTGKMLDEKMIRIKLDNHIDQLVQEEKG